MSKKIQFWFDPTTGTALWFLLAAVCMVVIVVSIRILFLRMQRSRKEKEFQDLLIKHGLWGNPEEEVVRSLAERHGIDPPANVLASLNAYDALAAEEIVRAERENVPLSNRIDRIEYLYSIRMQAFGHEPSVGGISALVPNIEPPTVARAPGFSESLRSEVVFPSQESESEQKADSTPYNSEDESDEMAKLLGIPDS